jgi:hypothetical protein
LNNEWSVDIRNPTIVGDAVFETRNCLKVEK